MNDCRLARTAPALCLLGCVAGGLLMITGVLAGPPGTRLLTAGLWASASSALGWVTARLCRRTGSRYGTCPRCGGLLEVHVSDNELAWLACGSCGAGVGLAGEVILPPQPHDRLREAPE